MLKLGFHQSDEDKEKSLIKYNEYSMNDEEIDLIALADKFEYQWKEYEVYYHFYIGIGNSFWRTLNIQNLKDLQDFVRIFWKE